MSTSGGIKMVGLGFVKNGSAKVYWYKEVRADEGLMWSCILSMLVLLTPINTTPPKTKGKD